MLRQQVLEVHGAAEQRDAVLAQQDREGLAVDVQEGGGLRAAPRGRALPGAAGYVVYTSNEFTLLDRTGQPRAAPDATLSQRLVAMQAAFDADPDRNAFTRVNDTLLTATSLDVAIPRGSQAIHAWIVLPVSAGGTEAPCNKKGKRNTHEVSNG